MRIRSFRLRDYAAITSMWKKTGLDGNELKSLEDLAKQLAMDSELVLIAETEEGKVIGVIVGLLDGGRGYFHQLAVDPAYQGSGVGKQLVQTLEERFRQRGAIKVVIILDQQFQHVAPFYYSLGYEAQKYVTLSKKLTNNG